MQCNSIPFSIGKMAWNASRRLLYLCPQSYFVMQKPNLYFSIGTRKCENRSATRVLCVCMELTASSSSHAHYQHLLPINTQAHMQCMYSKYHNGSQTHRRLLHVHHITKYNIIHNISVHTIYACNCMFTTLFLPFSRALVWC